MKNISIYTLICFICLTFNSCENALNVEPTNAVSEKTVLTSELNVKKLLVGTYQIAGNQYSWGCYIQLFSDLLGLEKEILWSGIFLDPRQALTKTMTANNLIVDQIWRNSYQVIGQCNIILDNLSLIKDDNELKRIEGEARFLRCFAYFELVRLFGSEYVGVPLRMIPIKDYTGDLTIKRNSTTEVYNAIKSDLNIAIALLPNKNSFYADKFSGLALRARIKLYNNDFEGALLDAHDVISNSGRKLEANIDNVYNRDANGSEDLFSIQVTSQSGENQLIQFYASQDNGGRGGVISLDDYFFKLFDDPNDERAHFYYENKRGDLLSSKYTNQFGNVPVIRLAEMYLIRAECNQRLRSLIGAATCEDISYLRARSGASSKITVDLNDILAERTRELIFEGMAIYDIKRTKKSIKGLPYNSPKLILPIPQSEMDSNKLMVQNEGY